MNRYNSTFKQGGKGFKRLSLGEARDRLREKQGKKPSRYGLKATKSNTRQRKPLRAKSDPKLQKWSREVRERDGNQCQFRKAFDSCRTSDTRIDPHHIAPRGRRPDLIYAVANGICLCRTHHDWCHDNPMQAEHEGYLNFDSYELAQKIKAGYVVPGDEHDRRVTL